MDVLCFIQLIYKLLIVIHWCGVIYFTHLSYIKLYQRYFYRFVHKIFSRMSIISDLIACMCKEIIHCQCIEIKFILKYLYVLGGTLVKRGTTCLYL
jgi:hypothetical protein